MCMCDEGSPVLEHDLQVHEVDRMTEKTILPFFCHVSVGKACLAVRHTWEGIQLFAVCLQMLARFGSRI